MSRSVGDSRADYTITLPGGTLCDVTASSKYELQCVTRALADDAYAEAPGLVDAEVAWNYEPFYFGCALRTCAPPGCKLAAGDPDEKLCLFEFTKESTPKFDHAPVRSNATFNRDSWFVAPGASLTLDVVREAPGGFNWTNISETLGGEDELADLFRVTVGGANCTDVAFDDDLKALTCAVDADARAGQESEIPNFKGSFLGRVPLVSADFWTSDHLSERSRSVDAFSGTRARGTLTLKRR